MADIHQFTKDKINALIESRLTVQDSRGYLGVSQIGHECPRHIWYAAHNADREPVAPRTLRIWERGTWEEDRIIKDLKSIGCNVFSTQAEVSLLDGRLKGHCDGVVEGLPISSKLHLLEIKTMNDASWKQYEKKGIYDVNMQYAVQCNVYAQALKLSRVLFVAVNKNTEERCFERWHTDHACANKYIIRTAEILTMFKPPDRIGGPDWYMCRFCTYRGICHG